LVYEQREADLKFETVDSSCITLSINPNLGKI
jgi:hypothetical protein